MVMPGIAWDDDRKQDKRDEPQLKVLKLTDTYGAFVVEPLPRGFGMTLGNPLRRVLLSSIGGVAINWVRIAGIEHEYSTIPNVKEDVIDILLNIKSINLRSDSNRQGKLRLEVDGPGEVSAGDIMTSSDFEIVNPELHIATLDGPNSRLEIEMNVEEGAGYVPAASSDGLPIGVLPVDAIYTPVRKVNYTVEHTRRGQYTEYERLQLEIWTNGATTPAVALRQAGQELNEYFHRFASVPDDLTEGGGAPSWASSIPASQFNLPVESLKLTQRTLNCLKRASLNKVGEVLAKDRSELLRIRNFGEKSLEELDAQLREMGIIHPGLQVEPAPVASASGQPDEE